MSRQVPEGYKQTEIGVIPEDWETSSVGAVCDFIVPGRNKPKRFDGDIPWITTPDIDEGRVVNTSVSDLHISREEAKEVGSKIVPSGSVIMSCAGDLGIVALTQSEIVVNQQLHVFIPTEHIDKRFLLNALAYQKKRIANYGTKTAVPYLNKDSCNSIVVPLPSVLEQRAIASTLSDIDSLLASLDQLIAKKRDLKQATMQQLLTGKKRLPSFGRNEEHQQTDVGTIPIDWKALQVSNICDFIVPGRNKPKLFDGDIPWITTPDLDEGKTVSASRLGLCVSLEEAKSVGSKIVPPHSVLMSCAGELGIVAMTENRVVVNQQLHVFIPTERINAVFLLNALSHQKEQIANRGTKTAVPYLNKDSCNSIVIPLPLLPEQTAIAKILTDIDTEITTLQTRRTKTQALKQAMMQQLLTGQTRLI